MRFAVIYALPVLQLALLLRLIFLLWIEQNGERVGIFTVYAIASAPLYMLWMTHMWRTWEWYSLAVCLVGVFATAEALSNSSATRSRSERAWVAAWCIIIASALTFIAFHYWQPLASLPRNVYLGMLISDVECSAILLCGLIYSMVHRPHLESADLDHQMILFLWFAAYAVGDSLSDPALKMVMNLGAQIAQTLALLFWINLYQWPSAYPIHR